MRSPLFNRPLKYLIGKWQVHWYLGPDYSRGRGFIARFGILKIKHVIPRGELLLSEDYDGFVLTLPQIRIRSAYTFYVFKETKPTRITVPISFYITT